MFCAVPPTQVLQTVPPFDSIPVGDTTRFRLPASALTQNPAPVIRWSSSSTTVADMFNDDGLAYGRAVGVTSITATALDAGGRCLQSQWQGTLKVLP